TSSSAALDDWTNLHLTFLDDEGPHARAPFEGNRLTKAQCAYGITQAGRTVFFGPPLAFQLEFRPIISLRGETAREKVGRAARCDDREQGARNRRAGSTPCGPRGRRAGPSRSISDQAGQHRRRPYLRGGTDRLGSSPARVHGDGSGGAERR